MVMTVVFYGTNAEKFALLAAIEHYCECRATGRCGPHQLLESQRALDGLVFERRQAERLIEEEYRG